MRFVILSVFGLLSFAAYSGPSFVEELWVRDDFLKAPTAAQLSTPYEGLVHSDASLALGLLPVPFPIELPEARGPLLFSPLPSYSHRGGLSEWGKGWERSLRIEHYSEVGEVSCSGRTYLSPWGELQESNEQNVFYPKGLDVDLRVVKTASGFSAYHPDGRVFEFARAYGGLAWYLTHVKDRVGHKTVFEYTITSTQRPLLSKIRYGGKKNAQYEIEIRYEKLNSPIKKFNGCGLETTIDQRVHEVEIKHFDGNEFIRAKLIHLVHDGVYLSSVQVEFPSGAKLPSIQYHYGKIESVVGKTFGRVHAQFQAATDPVDDLHFFSKHISWVDYNQDGLIDIERATDLKAFTQTAGGAFEPYQDFYLSNRDQLCPPSGPYNYFMAPAERRRTFIRPNGIKDNLYHLRLASDVTQLGSTTKIIVCTLEGQVAFQKDIFSKLESAMSLEYSTHLADLNRDLKPDLIKIGDEQYTYILNASTASQIGFEEKVTRPLPGADNRRVINYAIVDFNLDGIVDIVAQVRDGIMVWYGKGNQTFGPEENFFTFTTPEKWVLDLPKMQVISWLDVNRDGLVDLVASLNGSPIFFMQGKDTLLEQRFPALGDRLELLDSYRVINLSGGGNDQLSTLEWRHGYIYFDLNEAASGLLTQIDNNQGLSIEIGYTWTKPEIGVPQLMIVPKSLSISASGKETRSTLYEFSNADIDPQNGHLTGFQSVKTIVPHGTNAIKFLTSSEFSPKLQSSTKTDDRVEISQVERHEWKKAVISGIPYLQLIGTYLGYSSKSTEILKRSLAYSNYNRLCPQEIIENTPDGELARTIRYSDNGGCKKTAEKITGLHPGRAELNFEHAYEIERNDANLPLKLDLVSGSERIVKTALDYDADLNLRQVREAISLTTLGYDPVFEILRSLTEPAGTNYEAMKYDAEADAMSEFIVSHPDGQNLTQHFSYDEFGRLNSTGDNWSTTHFAYQLPTLSMPGLVVDSLSRVTQIIAGDGATLTQAREASNGFIYQPLHRFSSGGTIEQEIDLSRNHQDPRQLSFNELASENRVSSETSRSELFGLLSSKRAVNQNETHCVARETEANTRELQTTNVENSHYASKEARSFKTDESDLTTYFERDVLDRLREIRLPSGETQKVILDSFGRTEHISRSNVGDVFYYYDIANNRVSRKNVLGEEESFEYDSAGRLIKRDAYEFAYVGQRLKQVSHPDFTKRFNYAADGLPVKKSVTEHRHGSLLEIQFEYNLERDLVEQKVSYQKSYTKRFSYNQHRELQSVIVGQAVFDIKRNEVGKIERVVLPNGNEFIVEYDPVTWQRTGYEIPNVARYRWRLDARGLIDQAEFLQPNKKSQRFGYHYRPDKTLKSRYSLDNPFDLLTFELPEIPSSFTRANRLEGIYDENRHLLAKYRDGGLTFLQLGGVSVDSEHAYERLSIEGIDIGILVDGQFQLVLFDQIGSVIADGNFVSIPTPFGERQHSLTIGEHFDFAGHGRDQEKNLIQMGQREYDPQLRRFTSPDRFYLENPEECVRSPQECDLYSYARNNPLLYVDPSGQFVDIVVDIGFIGVGIHQLATDPSWINAAALGLDVVSAAVPFVVGGGRAFKAGMQVMDHSPDASKAIRALHKADNAAHPHSQHRTPASHADSHFPENPNHLLPDVARDRRGHIHVSENLRIRPEQHPMKPGETYCPRHHDQHYHVEIRSDPTKSWNNENYVTKVTPPGYKPRDGTGFLAGERFPGS